MAPKAKSNLSASLNKLAGNTKDSLPVPDPFPVESVPLPSQSKAPNKHDRPSRKSTKMIGAHFPREVSQALNILSAEQDTSNQALIAEALNDLFIKYGRPPVA
jgi:hypothetical protein